MSIETAAPKIELNEQGIPVVEGKTAEEVQQELFKAVKQINFYFSDSNLPTDKFFFSLTACNAEGWVPIKTILTFKRMRDFKPLGLPAIAHAISEAAKAEGDDPLLEVSEDALNVRRRRPLEPNSTMWDRSAYVKGFGAGDTEANTQELIEAYFAPYGKINAVRKRRNDVPSRGDLGRGRGSFKGSVFVEFAYEADLKKFVALPEIPKFGDEDMLYMTKDEYVKMKAKEKGISESEIQKGGQKKHVGKFNAFREMAKMQSGAAPQLAKIPSDMDIVGSRVAVESKRDNKRPRDRDGDSEKKKDNEPVTIDYKGVTLEVDVVTGKLVDASKVPIEERSAIKFSAPGEGSNWKELKEAVATTGGLANPFMAFPPGAKSGNVSKYEGGEITDEELATLQGANITYGGEPVTFERMNDEELRTFWTNRANFQASVAARNRAESGNGNKRFRNGGGGGGRGRGGKRGRGGNRGGHRGDRGDRDSGKSNGGLPPTVGAVSQ